MGCACEALGPRHVLYVFLKRWVITSGGSPIFVSCCSSARKLAYAVMIRCDSSDICGISCSTNERDQNASLTSSYITRTPTSSFCRVRISCLRKLYIGVVTEARKSPGGYGTPWPVWMDSSSKT